MDAHFYNQITGELTELGRQYGFPENADDNPEQYARALQRYEQDIEGKKRELDEAYIKELPSLEIHDKVEVIPDADVMYQQATSQCNVLLPALQNPQCSDETRESVISIVKEILDSFYDTDEIKKRKGQIYLENPDFFPREASLIRAKMAIKSHMDDLKSEIRQRRTRKVKSEDGISNDVGGDILAQGIQMGLIDEPKDAATANRQAHQIRKRLCLLLERT